MHSFSSLTYCVTKSVVLYSIYYETIARVFYLADFGWDTHKNLP